MVDALYTAQATARGGRNGEVVSDDGVLDLQLAMPKEMGGAGGDKTNPEQLFAAGYAACFHNALLRVGREQKLDLSDTSMTARVGIGRDGGNFGLTVALRGRFPSQDDKAALALMHDAHQVCPYSRATRGNIDVALELEN